MYTKYIWQGNLLGSRLSFTFILCWVQYNMCNFNLNFNCDLVAVFCFLIIHLNCMGKQIYNSVWCWHLFRKGDNSNIAVNNVDILILFDIEQFPIFGFKKSISIVYTCFVLIYTVELVKTEFWSKSEKNLPKFNKVLKHTTCINILFVNWKPVCCYVFMGKLLFTNTLHTDRGTAVNLNFHLKNIDKVTTGIFHLKVVEYPESSSDVNLLFPQREY